MAAQLIENAFEVFVALVEKGEATIQLPLAWATMTAAIKGEMDISKTLQVMEELKREALVSVGMTEDRVDLRVERLNSFFTHAAGFCGNMTTYNDPENSYMDDVLLRRTGIPITLSLVFIELGHACGLTIDPVAFPGHFLVREPTTGIICDPFGGLTGLKQIDCVRLLAQVTGREVEWDEQYLQRADKITILQRLLNNLKNSFVSTGNVVKLEKIEKLIARIDLIERDDQPVLLH